MVTNSTFSPVTMVTNWVTEVCGAILGLLVGEIGYRMFLLCKEYWRTKSGGGGKHGGAGGACGSITSPFSNQYNQVPSLAAVILASVALPLLLNSDIHSCAQSAGIASLVWFLLRVTGILPYTALHQEDEILRDNNSLVGPGLAVNYWYGFLKHLVKEGGGVGGGGGGDGDGVEELGGVGKRLEYLYDELMVTLAEMGYRNDDDLRGGNFSCFPKLIILLPDNCECNLVNVNNEKIFTLCDFDEKLVGRRGVDRLVFAREVNNSPLETSVHWIYRYQNDEEEEANLFSKERLMEHRLYSEKILILYDFPALLKSAMGPRRGWDSGSGPNSRKLNLTEFEKTLRKFLESRDYRENRNSVVFCSIDRPNKGESGRPLSHHIREIINQSTGGQLTSSQC